MNIKTTFFLLLLLVIVASVYYFAPPQTQKDNLPLSGNNQSNEVGQALFTADAFPTTDVDRVMIQLGDMQINWQKTGNQWRQTLPVNQTLERFAVDQWIDDAAKLRYVQAAQNAELPMSNHAQEKAVTFYFDAGTKREPVTLTLGSLLMIGARGHVKINDKSAVYVVNDTLHQNLKKEKLNKVRSKSITAPTAGSATHVILVQNNQTLQLAKHQGQWSLQGNQTGRASLDAIKTLLDDLGSMRITEFVADNPENLSLYGLDKPGCILTVTRSIPLPTHPGSPDPPLASEKALYETLTQQLCIGLPVDLKKEAYFATWAPANEKKLAVFTLSKYHVDKFKKTALDFRDKNISTLKKEEVRTIAVKNEQGTYALAINQGTWSFADPKPEYQADQLAVSSLLSDLLDTQAQAFVTQKKPTSEPLVTITLQVIANTQDEIITLYATQEEEQLLAYRNEETVGYQVDKPSLANWLRPVLSLRDKTILEIEPASLKQIRLMRAGNVDYTFAHSDATEDQSEPGAWQLQGHARFEQATFEQLLNALLPLRVADWAKQKKQDIPKQVQRITIQLLTQDDQTYTLSVDRPSGQAKLSFADTSQEAIADFTISQSLLDLLLEEYRDRTLFGFSSDAIKKVGIASKTDDAGLEIEITRNDAGDYVAAGVLALMVNSKPLVEGGEVKIDQDAAGKLFETLAGLRAKHYQPPRADMFTNNTTVFTLETKDQRIHILKLNATTLHAQLLLNTQVAQRTKAAAKPLTFTLDGEDVAALSAKLIQEEDPTK